MTTLSEPDTAVLGQPAADATAQLANTNRQALQFLMGAQKVVLEEVAFAGTELLDRAQTETHLLSEFISKMAGSHSVRDLKTMCEECSQHQIDFIRRDSERLFKHGERMLDATSRLFSRQPQN